MDQLPKKVLYAFYPDRILRYDQVVTRASVSLPYARNVINKEFIQDGYVEEIPVPRAGKKHDYFRLTAKGKVAVAQIHNEREWLRARITMLVASGMKPAEAAMQAAVESIKTDKLTS